MKVLLFLNGPEGWQTGIEDGFTSMKNAGEVSELKFFYLHDIASKHGIETAQSRAMEIAREFLPTAIAIFHIGNTNISNEFLANLRNIPSTPLLMYDEGDMYGSWAKPITIPMKRVIKAVDVVSIRGMGKFRKQVSKLNKTIIFTPNHADIARYDSEPGILRERSRKLVFVGNKTKPRFGASIRRLPGAKQREVFVKHMGENFPDEFYVYGSGWDNLIGNRGPIDFAKQLEIYRNTWINVSYEHYPNIPYFFSNRLPIALLAGTINVCHYRKGYEHFFKGQNFIFFYNDFDEATDIVKYLFSLDEEDLIARAYRARAFALAHLHPDIVWKNFLRNSLEASRNGK